MQEFKLIIGYTKKMDRAVFKVLEVKVEEDWSERKLKGIFEVKEGELPESYEELVAEKEIREPKGGEVVMRGGFEFDMEEKRFKAKSDGETTPEILQALSSIVKLMA